jgi:hypothetical protein
MFTGAPQAQVASEVVSGLRGVLDLCADPQKFARAVNNELRQIWKASTGFRPDAGERIATIDRMVENIRRAVDEGLNDASWANTRLRDYMRRGSRWSRPPDKQVVRPSSTLRLDKLFGTVAKLSAATPAYSGCGSEADAPELGGEHQLLHLYRYQRMSPFVGIGVSYSAARFPTAKIGLEVAVSQNTEFWHTRSHSSALWTMP